MEIEERLTAEHRRKLKEIAEQETRGEVGQAFMEAFIRRFVIALEAAMVLGPLDEAKQELEEHRNALRSTADALQAAREALAKVARHTPVEFPYRVEQAVLWSMRRYLAMSNGDVITPTLQTTRFLAGLEHSIRAVAEEVPMGGKFPSRLAPRLGAELANLYRLTFDKDARATNADTGTRFSRLIEVAIDVLGDDYKGPRSNGPRGRGPGARTVAMRGRSYWDQRLKRNSSQLLAAPEFPDAPAGDVFDLFIDGWNDVRHGSPPHDVAQAFLDALDARRREVSGNEGGDSDP